MSSYTLLSGRVRDSYCRKRGKLNLFLLTVFSLLMGLSSMAIPQPESSLISLNLKEAPLQKAFAAIKKQTDYRVIYDNSLLKLAKPVTLHVKNVSLSSVLKHLFELQPFEYRVVDQFGFVYIIQITTFYNFFKIMLIYWIFIHGNTI